MKKWLLFLLCFPLLTFGQSDADSTMLEGDAISPTAANLFVLPLVFQPGYGYFLTDLDVMLRSFNQYLLPHGYIPRGGTGFSDLHPVFKIGIDGYSADPDDNFAFSYQFNWLLPQQYQMFHDSVVYRLSGNHFSFNFGSGLFGSKSRIDFIPYLGVGWGKYKLRSFDETGRKRYNNPTFILSGMGELRFRFPLKKFGEAFKISFRGGYWWDISKGKWKVKNDGPLSLPGLKMTGWNGMVSLGIILYIASSNKAYPDTE
jgi:hypothetical protein